MHPFATVLLLHEYIYVSANHKDLVVTSQARLDILAVLSPNGYSNHGVYLSVEGRYVRAYLLVQAYQSTHGHIPLDLLLASSVSCVMMGCMCVVDSAGVLHCGSKVAIDA